MLEEKVESFFVEQVKSRGGIAVKLNPAGVKGIPDRLAIMRDRIIFVELKRPSGGVVARLQNWWIQRLRKLGHEAVVISSRQEVIELLDRDL